MQKEDSLKRFFFIQNVLKIKKIKQLEKESTIIHIAGTNGKTSMALMLSFFLKKANKSVGLFTSPHIYSIYERISFNGKKIKKELFKHYLKKILLLERKLKYKSFFFERLFIISLLFFRKQKPEFCIFETGIGGRYDITNIFRKKLVIIQSIHYDHMNRLGNTIDLITNEKLAIIKHNNLVFLGYQEFESIYKKCLKIVEKKKALLYTYGLDFFVQESDKNYYIKSLNCLFKLKKIRSFDIQKHQLINFSITISIFEKLGINFKFTNPSRKLLSILKKLQGRFEIFYPSNGSAPIIFDVGHNFQALSIVVEKLSNFYGDYKKNSVAIIGISYDKEFQSMIKVLSKYFENIIIVKLNFIKKEDISYIIYQEALKKNFKNVYYKDCFSKAYNLFESIYSKSILVISGSTYLVAEAKKKLKQN